jgi:hypothetical protein
MENQGELSILPNIDNYRDKFVHSLVFLDVSHEVFFPLAKVEVGDIGKVIGIDPQEERPLRVTFQNVPAWFFLTPKEVRIADDEEILRLDPVIEVFWLLKSLGVSMDPSD